MKSRAIRLALSFLPLPLLVISTFAKSDSSVNLGTAGSYAVLAGSTVTNTGSSVLTGNLGVWPGKGTRLWGSIRVQIRRLATFPTLKTLGITQL
jgi:hypothetical protein